MFMTQATEVRREWSSVCDNVMHERPQFIKRTRDKMCFSNFETMLDILEVYKYIALKFVEDDDSITLSLVDMDIIENGKTEDEARKNLAEAIWEYAIEFYESYKIYSNTPNRKKHVPYVLRALIMEDVKKIGEAIICLDGEN